MPIDFPSNPTIGQQYNYGGLNYVFNSQGMWSVTGSGGKYIAANTPPITAAAGDFWYDLTTGILSIYIDDNSTKQWVGVSPGGTGSQAGVLLANYNLSGLPTDYRIGPLTTLYDTIELDGIFFATGGSQLMMRVSCDGGVSYLTVNYWMSGPLSYYTPGTAAAGLTYAGGSYSQFAISPGGVGNLAYPASFNIKLKKPNVPGNFMRDFQWTNLQFDGTNVYYAQYSGMQAGNFGPISHLQFWPSTGENFGAGTYIKMYGR